MGANTLTGRIYTDFRVSSSHRYLTAFCHPLWSQQLLQRGMAACTTVGAACTTVGATETAAQQCGQIQQEYQYAKHWEWPHAGSAIAARQCVTSRQAPHHPNAYCFANKLTHFQTTRLGSSLQHAHQADYLGKWVKRWTRYSHDFLTLVAPPPAAPMLLRLTSRILRPSLGWAPLPFKKLKHV